MKSIGIFVIIVIVTAGFMIGPHALPYSFTNMDYVNEYKDWRGMTGKFGFGFHPTYVDKVLDELDKMGVKETNNFIHCIINVPSL